MPAYVVMALFTLHDPFGALVWTTEREWGRKMLGDDMGPHVIFF